MRFSILSSISSGSLKPSAQNSLMPLNSALLCEAEIITPALALYFFTRYATAGVGTTTIEGETYPLITITNESQVARINIDISSTYIRENLNNKDILNIIDKQVLEYIKKEKLYS